MSDLRSEMVNKVLNQWEKPVMDTGKKSFGERIFEYVKDHPYSSVDEIERGLGVDKKASVSSYLKSQLDKGLLAREEKLRLPYPGLGSRYYFVYYVISDSYTLPHKPRKRREVKAIKEPVVPQIHKQYELPRMRQFADVKPERAPKFDPHKFVDGLNVHDAKEVYLLLKNVFE